MRRFARLLAGSIWKVVDEYCEAPQCQAITQLGAHLTDAMILGDFPFRIVQLTPQH